MARPCEPVTCQLLALVMAHVCEHVTCQLLAGHMEVCMGCRDRCYAVCQARKQPSSLQAFFSELHLSLVCGLVCTCLYVPACTSLYGVVVLWW